MFICLVRSLSSVYTKSNKTHEDIGRSRINIGYFDFPVSSISNRGDRLFRRAKCTEALHVTFIVVTDRIRRVRAFSSEKFIVRMLLAVLVRLCFSSLFCSQKGNCKHQTNARCNEDKAESNQRRNEISPEEHR